MKTFKGGLQALQEEWESFLASQWYLDLSTCTLPKTPNTSPLDNAEQKAMSYQEYWRIKPGIYLCPILNKKQHLPLDEVKGNLKEKWTIQIQIDSFPLFPGDSFGIYPPNSQETLENLSQRFSFEHQPFHVLNHVSFRADFASFPKKAHLKYLGDFCSQEKQRQFLYFLCCSAGSQAYARLRDKFVGFEEIFQFFSFDGCSLEQLLRIVPLLQPRYYSLANCMRRNPSNSHHHPNPSSFLFSVEHFGLTSNWLPGLPIGFEVAVVQKAVQLFRFPFPRAGPIILIATGTGMAPFASLIEELAFQQASSTGESFSWPVLLFFGCRTPKDIVFPREIAQVSHSFISYSRVAPFQYVQDSLRENAALLREIFQSQDSEASSIWVCGSGGMVKDVTKVLGEILSNFEVIQQQKRFRIEIF